MLSAVGASATSTIDVSAIRLQLADASDVGVAAAVGFSHRYTDIMPGTGTTVDARVTVLDLTNLESDANDSASASTPDNKVEVVDETDSDAEDNINLELGIDVFGPSGTPSSGNVVLRVEFLESGSLVPVVLSNLSLFVADIDSNQFFQTSGLSSYRLSASTQLTARTNTDDPTIPRGSYRFVAPGVSSNSSDPEHWGEITISEASFVDFVLGAEEAGSASFDVVFTKADWGKDVPVETAIAAPAYTVTYDDNGSTTGKAPKAQSGSSFLTISGNTRKMVKPGFKFTGWNSAADGTGLVVNPAEQFRPTSDITLYAQWKKVKTLPAVEETLPETGASTIVMLMTAVLTVLIGVRMRRTALRRS